MKNLTCIRSITAPRTASPAVHEIDKHEIKSDIHAARLIDQTKSDIHAARLIDQNSNERLTDARGRVQHQQRLRQPA